MLRRGPAWCLALLCFPLHAAVLPDTLAQRLVACTGCHAPGAGIGVLHGRPAADTVAQLESFRSGARPATLMNRIVRGFSPAEVEALAAWFAAL